MFHSKLLFYSRAPVNRFPSSHGGSPKSSKKIRPWRLVLKPMMTLWCFIFSESPMNGDMVKTWIREGQWSIGTIFFWCFILWLELPNIHKSVLETIFKKPNLLVSLMLDAKLGIFASVRKFFRGCQTWRISLIRCLDIHQHPWYGGTPMAPWGYPHSWVVFVGDNPI